MPRAPRRSRPRQPRGRDAVRAAILRAAGDLFAARGPKAVSVRDIAARAGVNHGLVHRHFGSKQAVLRAVLSGLIRDIADAAGPAALDARFQQRIAETTTGSNYWRVVARAFLDGEVPRVLQAEFPIIRQLVEAFEVRRRRGDLAAEFDPRIAAAGTAAQWFGWVLFEPFLVAAAGLDDRPIEVVRREFFAARLALLERMR
jgi:AcrR family transcriptional regulator